MAFTCEATYSDGSKKAITPTWSITEGRNYATISSAGLVTAKSVTAQQRVTVKASYTEDGVTKEATWGFYVTIAAPSVPTGVTATQGTETSCIRVNWTAPSGATEYAVYRATANNGKNAQYLENVTVARYNDTSAVPGVDYWYFIKAKNSSGTSGFSAGANGWRKLSPPENVIASDTLLDKVALEWSDVEGANYYRVYRATSIDGAKSALGGWQTDTTFNDTMATAGVTCYYFVVAAVDASGNRPSDYSIVEDGMRAEPVRVASLSISGAASIASGGNATYTATVTYTDGTSKSVSPTWSLTAGAAYATISGAKVTAKTVTENQSVTLKASYSEDGQTVTSTKQVAITAVAPAAPTGLTLVSQTASGIALRWDSSAGAMSYRIYRIIGNGEASSVGSASATSFTDSTAVPGVAYAYSISAVNGAGESARSATVSGTVPLAVPAGVTATSDRTDGVLVSWHSVNGATHYRVARATSATGSKTDIGTWQTGTSYLDTSATAGTKYWYFVRAATSSSGANASAYSASAQGVRKVAVTLSYIAISGPDKVDSSGSAVYSCTAVYSDGTTKIVSPVWSVLPVALANVDSMGRLTAQTVSTDTSILLMASYLEDNLTKEASKDVSIVAPGLTSANVSDVKVHSRWPFSGMIDVDYFLKTEPEGTGAKIVLSAFDVDHGRVLFPKTLSGDGADGSVMPGMHRITWNVGADYADIHIDNLAISVESMVDDGANVVFTIEDGELLGVELNGDTEVIIPNTVRKIGTRAFANSAVCSVVIPPSVTNVGESAFLFCSSLTNVVISDSVTAIGSGAFSGCSSLEELVLPASLTCMGNHAFFGCEKLKSVSTPDCLSELCQGVFARCVNLRNVQLSQGVTNIAYNAFESCVNLCEVQIDAANPVYTVYNKIVYSKDMKTIVLVPQSIKDAEIVFSDSTIAIGDYAFAWCANLSAIEIPSHICHLGKGAFWQCENLKEIILPDGITRIDEFVFFDCSRLESVRLPDTVQYIGSYAFQDTIALKSIVVPSGVAIIGHHCFAGSGLESVRLPDTVQTIGSYAFYDTSSLDSVVIASGDIGNDAFGWSSVRSVEVGDGVDKLGGFFCCEKLETVVIREGVSEIGSCAFFDCKALKNITLPSSVVSVGGDAFYGSGLQELHILGDFMDYEKSSPLRMGYPGAVIYVTSNWNGPTGTWEGYVSVVIENVLLVAPSNVSAEMNGGNVEYTYAVGPRIPVRITTTVNLTWDKVGAATSYSIWKSSTNNPAEAACVANVDENSCSLTEVLEMGSSTMYYWVKAIGASSESDFSNAASVTWNWQSAL